MQQTSAPSRPIGVYDSGVGGLSVLRALRAALPRESFLYVADSGHAPYGDKPAAFVRSRAAQVAQFVAARDAKALVLACNTASVVAAAHLRAAHAMPIVAMEPAIKPAAAASRSRAVLVLATTNTIRSEAVTRLCRLHAKDARVILQPCPGLVEHVERGQFGGPETRRLLQHFIRPGLLAGADTIVLGCTHYAFLADEIAAIAGPSVTVIEPSKAIARQLARVLGADAALADGALGAATYYTSGDPDQLAALLPAVGEPAARVHPLPPL